MPRLRGSPRIHWLEGPVVDFDLTLTALQASTNGQKVRAIRGAAEQVSRHLRWHKQMKFLQPPALRTWQQYCAVLGTHDGYVVLQVRLGALIREVRRQRWLALLPRSCRACPRTSSLRVVRRARSLHGSTR